MSQLKLFPRQMRFVKDAQRYPAAVGGIGSGKTFVGAAKLISRLHRREVGLVCAPTYRMLQDSTQRTLFEMLAELGVKYQYNKTDKHLTLVSTGHEILFRSLDEPDNIRGPNVAYAWVDEAAFITAEAWRIVKGRVRVGDLQQAWITTTPKGRNWIYKEWVSEEDVANRYNLYRFRTDENPELSADYVEGLGYTGKFAQQEIGGEFVAFEGLVYGDFDREKHVRRVDTTGWHSVQGGDVGTRNPTTVLTLYFGPNGELHVGREFYQRGLSSKKILQAFLDEYDSEYPESLYLDPSAAAYIADLEEYDVPVLKANNDISTGVQTVSSYINNRFSIDPSCVYTISEFESYQYPDKENGPAGDKPVKQNDHCMDALRYAVMGYDRQGSLALTSDDLDRAVAPAFGDHE